MQNKRKKATDRLQASSKYSSWEKKNNAAATGAQGYQHRSCVSEAEAEAKAKAQAQAERGARIETQRWPLFRMWPADPKAAGDG